MPYTFNARFPKLWKSQRQFDNQRQVRRSGYFLSVRRNGFYTFPIARVIQIAVRVGQSRKMFLHNSKIVFIQISLTETLYSSAMAAADSETK